MGENEEVDGDVGDVSGEEAAWRDLIARFDLPVDALGEQAPWPPRESLPEAARDRQQPDSDASGWDQEGPQPGSGPRPSGRPAPDDLGPAGPALGGTEPGSPGLGDTEPGRADLGGPSLAGPNGAGPGVGGPGLAGPGLGPDLSGPDAAHLDRTSPGLAQPRARRLGAGKGGGHAAPSGFRVERARVVRRAQAIPRPAPARDDEEDDARYRPPPEPLPKLDSAAKGAWAGLLGGPGYLLVATLLGWQVSDWAALIAIVAFVAGFAVLVLRLGDRPRDDDDDGAVV